MARKYAPLHTSIWTNADFCSLPGHAQRVYLLAMSQANVSYAGVVPFTEKRWAAMAGDTTRGEINDAVNVLIDRGYVVLDDETEELWVRSFVKYNRILEQPQLKKSLLSAYDAVLSTGIQRAIYDALPDDVKAQVTSPTDPCPPPSPEGSSAGSYTGQGQGLDLDLNSDKNQEGEPSAPVSSRAHPLLAPGRPLSLSDELDQIVMVLIDEHGPDRVDAAVQQLLDDKRKFPWPNDARKALVAILGDPPAKDRPNVLDDAQRAQMAMAERGLDHVRELLNDPDVAQSPEERKRILERVKKGAA